MRRIGIRVIGFKDGRRVHRGRVLGWGGGWKEEEAEEKARMTKLDSIDAHDTQIISLPQRDFPQVLHRRTQRQTTSQTLLEQRHRLRILLLQIPVPNPMHPRLQPLLDLAQIAPDALRQHAKQSARLPRRLDDALAARPPYLIVRREGVGDGPGVANAPEQGFEHERVFDGLAGALALEGRRGVRGVAHHGDVADGVGGCGEVVAHGPDGEGGAVDEGDEVAGFVAPAGKEGVELGVGGGHDPLLALPAGALKVHDDDVEDLAEVDGVAEDGFAWEVG